MNGLRDVLHKFMIPQIQSMYLMRSIPGLVYHPVRLTLKTNTQLVIVDGTPDSTCKAQDKSLISVNYDIKYWHKQFLLKTKIISGLHINLLFFCNSTPLKIISLLIKRKTYRALNI